MWWMTSACPSASGTLSETIIRTVDLRTAGEILKNGKLIYQNLSKLQLLKCVYQYFCVSTVLYGN